MMNFRSVLQISPRLNRLVLAFLARRTQKESELNKWAVRENVRVAESGKISLNTTLRKRTRN